MRLPQFLFDCTTLLRPSVLCLAIVSLSLCVTGFAIDAERSNEQFLARYRKGVEKLDRDFAMFQAEGRYIEKDETRRFRLMRRGSMRRLDLIRGDDNGNGDSQYCLVVNDDRSFSVRFDKGLNSNAFYLANRNIPAPVKLDDMQTIFPGVSFATQFFETDLLSFLESEGVTFAATRGPANELGQMTRVTFTYEITEDGQEAVFYGEADLLDDYNYAISSYRYAGRPLTEGRYLERTVDYRVGDSGTLGPISVVETSVRNGVPTSESSRVEFHSFSIQPPASGVFELDAFGIGENQRAALKGLGSLLGIAMLLLVLAALAAAWRRQRQIAAGN